MTRRAVEGLHACHASHRETVQVREDFKEQTVWDGGIHGSSVVSQ
jgi:hypothetical protein